MENKKKYLYCINIGDTKCILLQNTGSRKLSYDDVASDPNEYKRVINEGGMIKNGRIGGKIILSRAFGDWDQKKIGLISTPHINKIEILNSYRYVIIATDGIWDVLDDLDVYSLSLTAKNSKDLCDKIIDSALEKNTKDNLSCFVIKLNI